MTPAKGVTTNPRMAVKVKSSGGDVTRTNAPRDSYLPVHNNAQNLNIADALGSMICRLGGSVAVSIIRELKVIRDAASNVHEHGRRQVAKVSPAPYLLPACDKLNAEMSEARADSGAKPLTSIQN